MRIFSIFVITLTLGALLSACAEEVVEVDPRIPQVNALSKKALVVGEPLSFYGHNFLAPHEGVTKLVFEGKFFPQGDDGTLLPPEAVSQYTIQPLYDGVYPEGGAEFGLALDAGTTVLRWNRFGPFQVPFGASGNKPGTFKGTVAAVNHFGDGTKFKSEAVDISIDVKPSLIFTKLEPIVDYTENNELVLADCGAPALRGLSGHPYVMAVEAIGFKPEYFIWEVSNINGKEEWSKFTHQASGRMEDRLGDPYFNEQDPAIYFNKIADEAGFNLAAIRVTGVDSNGNAYYAALPLSVVRPMAFNYDGRRELAEYYEPIAVNGPITGAIGSELTYSETHAEQRQRGVSLSMSNSFVKTQSSSNSENWSEGVSSTETNSVSNSVGQSHSESSNSNETYGVQYNKSEANSQDFSSSKGTNWGWQKNSETSEEEFKTKTGEVFGSVNSEVSASASAEGSIPGFAKVSGTVGTKFGAEVGAKSGNQEGVKEGSSQSYGNNMNESSNEQTAFGSVTVDGQSQSMGGSFGLAKQDSINSTTQESEAKSNSVTFNLGGAETVTDGVSEGKQKTWGETWVNTESDSTLVAYKSKVPNGRCAAVYRQTVRYVRRAQLYSYDLCGVRSLAGEAVFNEWSWSPNIAIGNDCSDGLPPSTLPKATCFLACE